MVPKEDKSAGRFKIENEEGKANGRCGRRESAKCEDDDHANCLNRREARQLAPVDRISRRAMRRTFPLPTHLQTQTDPNGQSENNEIRGDVDAIIEHLDVGQRHWTLWFRSDFPESTDGLALEDGRLVSQTPHYESSINDGTSIGRVGKVDLGHLRRKGQSYKP